MKIYTIITKSGMYVTADKYLATHIPLRENLRVEAVIEWEVKTQGKNFNTFGKGKYIIYNRKK